MESDYRGRGRPAQTWEDDDEESQPEQRVDFKRKRNSTHKSSPDYRSSKRKWTSGEDYVPSSNAPRPPAAAPQIVEAVSFKRLRQDNLHSFLEEDFRETNELDDDEAECTICSLGLFSTLISNTDDRLLDYETHIMDIYRENLYRVKKQVLMREIAIFINRKVLPELRTMNPDLILPKEITGLDVYRHLRYCMEEISLIFKEMSSRVNVLHRKAAECAVVRTDQGDRFDLNQTKAMRELQESLVRLLQVDTGRLLNRVQNLTAEPSGRISRVSTAATAIHGPVSSSAGGRRPGALGLGIGTSGVRSTAGVPTTGGKSQSSSGWSSRLILE